MSESENAGIHYDTVGNFYLWGANYYLTPRSRVELEFAPHTANTLDPPDLGIVGASGHATRLHSRTISYDDDHIDFRALPLALNARQTADFNSDDLEFDKAEKGLTESTR